MEEVETAEELLAKQHRNEKKDLQAKIQSMKNANSLKNIENELEQLQNSSLVQEVSNAVDFLSLGNSDGKNNDLSKQTRTSKAQKRRDKKAAFEKALESQIAEVEVENLTGSRHQEGLKLRQKLMERHLQIREISSDGHCMYRAVEDQLTERGATLSLKELRAQTAQYMRSHADDFLPFLTDPNSGDMYTADEFEKYCNDVADTAAWGGQLELKALSQVLQLPIEVIQAESPSIIIGEEYVNYMRHACGLGEHYNSVEPLKDLANEEEG
uniref:ubiquitinyl hydrolase 1 n=1 Tax=Sinocyclocheilus grahami TaxID=75366 RepID=A0A672SN83_SINGR